MDDGEAQVRRALRPAVEVAQESDPLAWLRGGPGEVDDVDVLLMLKVENILLVLFFTV